jgi:hypothetical protein
VSTANPAASPAGSLLDRVERTAWRVPLPTRRLYVTLALVAAVALAFSGLVAGWVANRNANTIDDAREQGLELATAVTEFRTNLAAADATAAATLIAGGLESTDSRAQYDTDLLQASRALTDAGLVARADDRDDIRAMANGLVTYAGLVETSRANSRLGYPVGSAYLNQARDLANDDLVPRAERLRREGERRVAQAANTVGGPVTLSALAVILLGAGRSRRVIAHPALVAALVAIVAALGVMVYGITSQASELRRAAGEDIDAFVAANATSSGLSDLRVTEISAVAARGSGGALYDTFDERSAELLDGLEADGDDPAAAQVSDLHGRIDAYVTTVGEVRALDDAGNNRDAAILALSLEPGGSAHAYDLAATGQKVENNEGILVPPSPPDPASAAGLVDRETADLEDRFDAAADAGIHPVLPVALAVLAAVLAVVGTLARGRRYR